MSFQPSQFEAGRLTIRRNWGWFTALGVLAAVSGVLALILVETATIASVVAVGVLMMITGGAEMALGFRARSWGQVIYWEVAGLLYLVAGIFAIAEPLPATLVITLILGAGLLATGVIRLIAGFGRHDRETRLPLLVGGTVTALLGLIIVVGWPGNSLFVIGTLLGIDLLFNGIAWIMFGLRLRARA